jgi:hypothetical protein
MGLGFDTGAVGTVTRRMTITSGGSIGIGTTSPTEVLDVRGTIRISRSGVNDSGILAFGNFLSGAGYFDNGIFRSALNAPSTAGNVLHMASYEALAFTTSATSFGSQAIRMYIQGSDGNIGIGTTSPSYKLDVQGTGRFTGTLNADSNITFSGYIKPSSNVGYGVKSADGTVLQEWYNGSTYHYGLFVNSDRIQITSNGGTNPVLAIRQTNASNQGYDFETEDVSVGRLDLYGVTSSGRVQAMTWIKASGNVGIGTTSPDQKLHVEGNDANAVQFKIKNNNVGNGNKYLAMFVGGTTGYSVNGWANSGVIESAAGTSSNLVLSNYEAGPIIFQTNDRNERMRITSGGNVGIGTTSPGEKLQVNGNIAINNGGYGWIYGNDVNHSIIMRGNRDGTAQNYTSYYQYGGTLADGKGHMFYTGGDLASQTLKMQIADNGTYIAGNVGIGTTSPSQKLDVQGNIYANGDIRSQGIFRDYQGEALLQTNTSAVTLLGSSGASTSRTLAFLAGNAERMRITTGGNVGIGATSPSGLLEVYKSNSGGLGGHIILNNNGAAVANETAIIFQDGGTDGVRAAISSTTEDAPYLGDLKFKTGLSVYGSLNTRMIIKGGGNIGIGTSSPNTKLDVWGTVRTTVTSGYFADFTYLGNTYTFGSGEATDNVDFKVAGGGTFTSGGNFRFFTQVGGTTPTEKMRITPGGNVGIGTTSPREKLHVTGNTVIGSAGLNSYKTNLYLTYNASSDETWIRIYVPQDYVSSNNGGTVRVRVLWEGDHATFGAYQDYQISYKTFYPSSPYLKFSNVLCMNKTSDFVTGATYYPASSTPDVLFYDNSDGYLYAKIKGTNTSYNTARYVEAEIFGRTTAQPTIATTSAPGSPSELTKTIQFLPQEGNIYASGNVGIGTTSPSSILQIEQATPIFTLNQTTTNSNQGIYFNNNGSNYGRITNNAATGLMTIQNGLNSGDGYLIRFITDGSERMRIISNGNIGIGTTSPAYKLDVGGSIKGGDYGAVPNSTWNGLFLTTAALGGNTGNAGVYISAPYDSDGNNNGFFRAKRGSGNTYNGIEIATSNQFRILTSTTEDTNERLRINSSGNVGIGSSSPSYLLDVAGTIRATGDVIAYSDARVKDNVQTVENALSTITSMRGVTYTRKDNEDKSRKVGVIAQEVLEVLPEVVQQDDNGNYSVAYGNIVGVLIEAIKELKTEVEDLKYLLSQKQN